MICCSVHYNRVFSNCRLGRSLLWWKGRSPKIYDTNILKAVGVMECYEPNIMADFYSITLVILIIITDSISIIVKTSLDRPRIG